MTRRDYILIATALRQAYQEIDGTTICRMPSALSGIEHTAETIAIYLETDNPHFDRNHFLAVVRGEKELNSRPTRKAGA